MAPGAREDIEFQSMLQLRLLALNHLRPSLIEALLVKHHAWKNGLTARGHCKTCIL